MLYKKWGSPSWNRDKFQSCIVKRKTGTKQCALYALLSVKTGEEQTHACVWVESIWKNTPETGDAICSWEGKRRELR